MSRQNMKYFCANAIYSAAINRKKIKTAEQSKSNKKIRGQPHGCPRTSIK